MTITSFDTEIPMTFFNEKTLQGRLSIFLNHVMCRVLKRDLIKKERDKISFIVVDKQNLELKYDDNFIGIVTMVGFSKDFIFKQ